MKLKKITVGLKPLEKEENITKIKGKINYGWSEVGKGEGGEF